MSNKSSEQQYKGGNVIRTWNIEDSKFWREHGKKLQTETLSSLFPHYSLLFQFG